MLSILGTVTIPLSAFPCPKPEANLDLGEHLSLVCAEKDVVSKEGGDSHAGEELKHPDVRK